MLFWDVMPCRVVHRYYFSGWSCYLHLPTLCGVVLPNHWYPCTKWQNIYHISESHNINIPNGCCFLMLLVHSHCCVSSCAVTIKITISQTRLCRILHGLSVALCYDSDVMLPTHHNFRHVSWQLLSIDESDSDPEHGTWRCPDAVARIGYCWCMLQSYESDHWHIT
jgi:hypothetical protein